MVSDNRRKIVIVGGVAGGATAAARLRRLDEDAEIVMFERGAQVSFANCGLPYHIGGEIPRRSRLLVQTKEGLSRRFAIDIRTSSEVLAIDRRARMVRVRDLARHQEYDETYDVLLLSPGAQPIRPPVPGVDHPRVCTLRSLADMDRIKRAVDSGARQALVVGGGFIGLEMAENLRRRGLDVALIELLPQVLSPLDPEMAAVLHTELTAHDVQLHLADAVTAFEEVDGRVVATLRSGTKLTADLVVLAVGVRPETGLARDARLELNDRGAMVVDDHMRTSDPDIYAVGDAVQVHDPVLGGPALIPLAGPANRQARIAADNICGRDSSYRGTLGTSIVRVFSQTAALTGASEKTLRQGNLPHRKIYVRPSHHAGYFPGAQPMLIKLLVNAEDGRLLGAQIVGRAGVDKRIDVLAVALHAGMTARDLEELELAYAPPYGAAKDPVNIVGFVAANIMRGDVAQALAEELDEVQRANWTIIDVRTDDEFLTDHIPGAIQIPLSELRARREEIPRDKPIVLYCATGQRSYYAACLLRQRGVPCKSLAGGMAVFRLLYARDDATAAGPTGADSGGCK